MAHDAMNLAGTFRAGTSQARKIEQVAEIPGRRFLPTALVFLWLATAAWGQSSGVYREVYYPLSASGNSLAALTNDSSFPDAPANGLTSILIDVFEAPNNVLDHYGQRCRALILPPVTGTYVFWLAANFSGALYVSGDESPFDKVQIASQNLGVCPRCWYNFANQQSTNIFLEAGRRYYIEALQVAGNGDDALAVGWKLPDGTLEQPIPISRLVVFGQPAISAPVLTSQPTNVTALENSPASFRVTVSNPDGVTYQWQRYGTNLPGVAGAVYSILSAGPNDNGSSVRCIVANSFGSVASVTATLTVIPDTVSPTIFDVANLNSNTVEVLFSEAMEPASATNIANYSINNGVAITRAAFGDSASALRLTASPLLQGSSYTLTVSNVRDRAAARNIIQNNSQQAFTVLLKGIYREVFTNIPGTHVADLTNSPAFPNNPSSAGLLPDRFEAPRSGINSYGQRLRARIIPPRTGNYTFWVAADDAAALFLSTNNNPANARQIASVSSASLVSPGQWDVQANQKSALIPLVAGQQYYIEALMKEGISTFSPAEHLAVRWQLPNGAFEEPISATRLSPVGLNLPRVAVQPAYVTVVEGGTATFTVKASNVDPIAFQWQRDGANIPGATNDAFTIPLVQLGDDGSIFQCVLMNAAGSTNSIGALLTVNPDVTPPGFANVVNNGPNRVVVFFSEPVDAVSATDLANYSIPGITILAAVLDADNDQVNLSTTPLSIGSVYTLTVNGVRDRAATPNTIALNSHWSFLAGDFFPQDIGDPPLPGTMTVSTNGMDIFGSGSGSAGLIDQFNFTYQQQRGNFDVKVRVQRLSFADMLTQAGLMVREDTGTNSRFAAVFSTPSIAGSFFQFRSATNSAAQTEGNFPVNYPDTWLRLQRTGSGSSFKGYASFDGQNWTLLGTAFIEMHASVLLGFAVASHNLSEGTFAQFRDFSDSTGDQEGLLPVTTEPLGPSSRRTGLAFTEIMYHPGPRSDGRDTEFIELFNSNPFYQDLSGYRISGDVGFTFPQGTILPGGGFLVIANKPADVQAVYGIRNVMGPYTKSLSNGNGTVRLRNPTDAILLEVNYNSKAPWPLAADGTGHSLVLARPSWGEDNPKAWAQSSVIGGSPGGGDPLRFEPVRNVLINEFLANSLLPDLDYIELYNHSAVAVDLSGCWLSDTPGVNKFRIPDGTTIGPAGFVYFTEADFNPTPGTNNSFALSSAGEAIYLVSSNLSLVIDCVAFGAQETGVATGRFPDGAPTFSRLAAKTPGGPNAPLRNRNIVINEIMHAPVTDDDNDQFVELYNRGTNTISLANWQFTAGINFTFPSNTVIPANGYMVIAKSAAHLLTNYPNLNSNNTLGDFGGSLGHSGDRLTLSMPDYVVTTNASGVVQTNIDYIAVDEVTYGKGGKWGKWNDGGGSSLELIDPHSDNRLPSNWADSDDTAKSSATTLSVTGTLDNGDGTNSLNNSLQIYLLDAGECLIDTINVVIDGSANLVTNADFESTSLNNWIFQGDHMFSTIGSPALAGSRSLHLIADDRGDPAANRIYTLLLTRYTTGVQGSISARVKWLHGRPEIIFRLRGNLLELTGQMAIPKNLGTPGARNSRYATNAGPAVTEVIHSPVLPAASQPVMVTARVHDPDGIASVQLVYRVDDSFTPPVTNIMVDNGIGADAVAGDGIYSGTIPGQVSGAMVAFYVQARDNFSPPATGRFPSAAPARECLVHFGDSQPFGSYGTYRFWLTKASYNQWVANPKLSNEGNPGTFVYGNSRVIYNATDRYGGSPFHAPLLDTPDGTNCDYYVEVPTDDTFLNTTAFTLQSPGNFGRDATGQSEETAYWMAAQLGLPYLYRRPINVFFNGLHRGFIYEDTQQPGSDLDAEFYPNSASGTLHKVQYDFETTDDTVGHSTTPASLQEFLTTGGVKKLAVYRETFTARSVNGSPYNYTNLYNLVDAVNTTATGDAYLAQVSPFVDMKEWMGIFALERMFNNTDLYGNQKQSGNPGGQNCYIYQPDGDSWKFLMWDVDFCFSGLPTDPLFNFADPPIANLCAQPFVLRTYWQALQDEANGPWDPANAFPPIDARYNAYLANGIPAGSPAALKNFISVRHDHVLQLLADNPADFAITSNKGNNFTNGSTVVTLSGTAPFSMRDMKINGVSYPLSWTSITNWSVQIPLSSQTNQLVAQGYDAVGAALSNATRQITIYYNGLISRPQDSLVINEVLYRPAVSNASYVEIYNRSANTTFGLLNYRLQGVDFNFSPATLIDPQSFLVVVKDPAAFRAAYGANARIAGTFNGNLDPGGETLSLIKQALTTNEADLVVSKMKYEARPPWSTRAAATNSGASLQLIDSTQDNARVSNWDDGANWHYASFTGIPGGTRLYFYLDSGSSSSPAEIYLDEIKLVAGTVAAVGSNYVRNGDFEAPLTGIWNFLTSSSTPTGVLANNFAHSGSNSLRLTFTKAGSTSICMYQDITSIGSGNYTLSFWYRWSSNANNLTARVGGSSFSPSINVRPVLATPGAPNSVAGTVSPYPLLWLNEVQPNNATGLQDNTGARQPWVELFNSGTTDLLLDGYSLAKTYAQAPILNPQLTWAFPAGTVVQAGKFRVIFVDGQPNLSAGTVLHTSFRLDPTNGSIILSRGPQILDYLNYTNLTPDLSYGAWPDGQLFDRQLFYFVTPGASNNPAPVPVAINEWMASNTRTLVNPANNRFDDWFELYNFGVDTLNLSGYFLTDNLGNKNMWRIPQGTLMPPHTFLLCWADNLAVTNAAGGPLHVNFNLSKSGDNIGLFSPTGIKVDSVSFGPQISDFSQGHYPDGDVNGVFNTMQAPTPGTNNVITNNLYAPVLSAIPNHTIAEGELLSFIAQASDADVPAQTLTFSLLAGAPQGASITPGGVFAWRPGETHGGATYPIAVVVSDNAAPPARGTNVFNVTVLEVNNPPTIGSIADWTTDPNSPISLSIPAMDSDLPPQILSYRLLTAPAGANLDANGRFNWTPTQAQAPSTNRIVVSVTDNGGPPLSATQSFTVFVTPGNTCSGYKADVRGDGFVSIPDWVLVGKLVANPASIADDCQFAKVDSSPRITCGNGSIGVTDWIQAGRYAAGLDPLVSCGLIAPPTSAPPNPADDPGGSNELRSLTISDLVVARGETGCLQILFNSHGDENGLGWSLSFDPYLLTFSSATLANYATNAAFFFINDLLIADGQLGFAFLLPTGATFPAGSQVLAQVCFQALAGTETITTSITVADIPARRGVSDPNGTNLLASTTFTNGTVTITGTEIAFESITPQEGGQVRLTLIGPAGGIFELQGSSDLVHWQRIAELTNATGRLDYPVSTNGSPHFYRTVASP